MQYPIPETWALLTRSCSRTPAQILTPHPLFLPPHRHRQQSGCWNPPDQHRVSRAAGGSPLTQNLSLHSTPWPPSASRRLPSQAPRSFDAPTHQLFLTQCTLQIAPSPNAAPNGGPQIAGFCPGARAQSSQNLRPRHPGRSATARPVGATARPLLSAVTHRLQRLAASRRRRHPAGVWVTPGANSSRSSALPAHLLASITWSQRNASLLKNPALSHKLP